MISKSETVVFSILPEALRAKGLLSTQDLATLLGQRPQSVAKARMQGRGPKYLKIGRSIRYAAGAVEMYLAGSTVESSN